MDVFRGKEQKMAMAPRLAFKNKTYRVCGASLAGSGFTCIISTGVTLKSRVEMIIPFLKVRKLKVVNPETLCQSVVELGGLGRDFPGRSH